MKKVILLSSLTALFFCFIQANSFALPNKGKPEKSIQGKHLVSAVMQNDISLVNHDFDPQTHFDIIACETFIAERNFSGYIDLAARQANDYHKRQIFIEASRGPPKL